MKRFALSLAFLIAFFGAQASAQITASFLVAPYNPCTVFGTALGCAEPGEMVALVQVSGSGPAMVTLRYLSGGSLQEQSYSVDVRGSDLCVFILPGDASGFSLVVEPVRFASKPRVLRTH